MIKKDPSKEPVTMERFDKFSRDVDKRFNDLQKEFSTSLNGVKDILAQHSKALLSIENTMKFYGDMYKLNRDSIEKLDVRVTALERV